MADYPADLRYTRDHEWVRPGGPFVAAGITSFAARELGEVVFVELPYSGEIIQAGEPFGTVESVKAVSELYMPVLGQIKEVNESLRDSPESLNDDPYGDGWIVKIEPHNMADLDELLDSKAYEAFLAEGE